MNNSLPITHIAGAITPEGGNGGTTTYSCPYLGHCFCQDTGGAWRCCRCGVPLLPTSRVYFRPTSYEFPVRAWK